MEIGVSARLGLTFFVEKESSYSLEQQWALLGSRGPFPVRPLKSEPVPYSDALVIELS